VGERIEVLASRPLSPALVKATPVVVNGEERASVPAPSLEEEPLECPRLPVFANTRLRVEAAKDGRHIPRQRPGIVCLNDNERSRLERLQPTSLDNAEAVLLRRFLQPGKELVFGQGVETSRRIIFCACSECLPPLLL
jgi:hypothetical protein